MGLLVLKVLLQLYYVLWRCHLADWTLDELQSGHGTLSYSESPNTRALIREGESADDALASSRKFWVFQRQPTEAITEIFHTFSLQYCINIAESYAMYRSAIGG